MAKQETRDQQAQGTAMSPQPGNRIRAAGFPAAVMLAPGDFLQMGPFTLMRRMSEEMDRVFGEFGLTRGEGRKAGWAPAIEVSQADGTYLIRAEKSREIPIEPGTLIRQGHS
jgi:hypothetical protein